MTIDYTSFGYGAAAGVIGMLLIFGLFYIAKKKKNQSMGVGFNKRYSQQPMQPFQRKQRGMQKPFFKRRQQQQMPIQRQRPRYQPQPQPIYQEPEQQYEEPYVEQEPEVYYDDGKFQPEPEQQQYEEPQYEEPYQEYPEDNYGGR